MGNYRKQNTSLIIVGGGIFGSAIAYYYKRDNPDNDVVVYERNELCSGNTSLAAALLSRARSYGHVIPLSLETYRVIPELVKITGDEIPVHYNGALHLAVKAESKVQLEEMLAVASRVQIDWELISVEQAKQKVPWLAAPEDASIALIPGEAYTDPYLLGMSFANAARLLGVKFVRNTGVIELLKNGNFVIGVRTQERVHHADTTILAAGVWSTILAYKIGIALPMAPVRSQYWITEESESIFPAESPTVLIPEANFYSRPQGNAILFGIREAHSMVADPLDLTDEVGKYVFSTDSGWRDLEEEYETLLPFFPGFENIGIKNYVAGFSAYTPDSQFILGEVDGIEGLLLATGCSGAGISVAGGVGLGIASMAGGKINPFDFSSYRCQRFGNFDPFSAAHLERCAAARSQKRSG